MANFLDMLKRVFNPIVAIQQASQAVNRNDPTSITDRMLNDLALAEAIYMDEPPWLNEESPPLTATGVGSLAAMEIACMITIEAKISVNDNDEIDDIIQSFLMPNLRMEIEKGWALGGLIFKPYYNNAVFTLDSSNNIIGVDGKLKLAFLYPSEFIIEEADNSGAILSIKFFDTVVENHKFYTRVEHQLYDEVTRALTITNTVYRTTVSPTKYKWDNLGSDIVSLDSIDQWKNMLPKMTFQNVSGCLVGYFRPAVANNSDLNSPYGLSPLVRARHALRRVDRAANGLDWELDTTQARLYVDERAMIGTETLSTKLARHVTKLIGDNDKKFFEIFSPEIRHNSYVRILNTYLRQAEDAIGLARGTLSDVGEVSRTATEIAKTKQRTYVTIVDNQQNLEIGVRQLVRAIQVWLAPTVVEEEPSQTYDFDDSVVSNPQEQLALYMILQNAGNIPAWKTNMMYFNASEEEAKEMFEEAQIDQRERLLNKDIGTSSTKIRRTTANNTVAVEEIPPVNPIIPIM